MSQAIGTIMTAEIEGDAYVGPVVSASRSETKLVMTKVPGHLVLGHLDFDAWLSEVSKFFRDAPRGKPHRGQKTHKGKDGRPEKKARKSA